MVVLPTRSLMLHEGQKETDFDIRLLMVPPRL
jgi:hypothetical protein